jgi:hypothetical protein
MAYECRKPPGETGGHESGTDFVHHQTTQGKPTQRKAKPIAAWGHSSRPRLLSCTRGAGAGSWPCSTPSSGHCFCPTPTGRGTPRVLEEVASQQVVGSIQGLPVVTDPNIETNLGTGGDEDPVYVLSRIRRCAVGVGDQGKGITGDQGAEPHGAVAAVWLPGVLCGPLPAERRRAHRPDGTDVLRRFGATAQLSFGGH